LIFGYENPLLGCRKVFVCPRVEVAALEMPERHPEFGVLIFENWYIFLLLK
jgi:hypothetical protein